MKRVLYKKMIPVNCNPQKCGNGKCWSCQSKICYECDRNSCKNHTSRPCTVLTPEEWERRELLKYAKTV